MVEPFRFFMEMEDDKEFIEKYTKFQQIKYTMSGCSITGNKKSSLSTLLFQYSYSLALESKNILYICQKSKIQSNSPLLSFQQLDEESLGRIKIKFFFFELKTKDTSKMILISENSFLNYTNL
jgi:hypothetical protein